MGTFLFLTESIGLLPSDPGVSVDEAAYRRFPKAYGFCVSVFQLTASLKGMTRLASSILGLSNLISMMVSAVNSTADATRLRTGNPARVMYRFWEKFSSR